MTASDLRDVVTIQSVTVGTDETEAVATVDDVWASIRPLRAGESVQAGQVIPTVGYSVVIRYRDGVTAAHRLLWGTRTLQIHGAYDHAGDRRWLTLSCTERA